MRSSWLICAVAVRAIRAGHDATSGNVAIRFSTALIRVTTAGSRTVPVPTRQTIVSESPDWAGTVLASSCWAVVEPVPGSEKELLYSALGGLGERAQADQREHPGRDDGEPVAEAPPCDGRHENLRGVKRIR